MAVEDKKILLLYDPNQDQSFKAAYNTASIIPRKKDSSFDLLEPQSTEELKKDDEPFQEADLVCIFGDNKTIYTTIEMLNRMAPKNATSHENNSPNRKILLPVLIPEEKALRRWSRGIRFLPSRWYEEVFSMITRPVIGQLSHDLRLINDVLETGNNGIGFNNKVAIPNGNVQVGDVVWSGVDNRARSTPKPIKKGTHISLYDHHTSIGRTTTRAANPLNISLVPYGINNKLVEKRAIALVSTSGFLDVLNGLPYTENDVSDPTPENFHLRVIFDAVRHKDSEDTVTDVQKQTLGVHVFPITRPSGIIFATV